MTATNEGRLPQTKVDGGIRIKKSTKEWLPYVKIIL